MQKKEGGLIEESRYCSECQELKLVSEFHKDKSRKGGIRYVCNECRRKIRHEYYKNNKKETALKVKEWKDNNMAKAKEIGWNNQGIKFTYEQYLEMLKTQDYRCAICGKQLEINNKHTHVDHCHNTGIVRGILCGKCNTGLGFFDDSIKKLNNAINYLGRFQIMCFYVGIFILQYFNIILFIGCVIAG